MSISILYRGSLASCNYGCPYCPFAKHVESKEEHNRDRVALERFVDWIAANDQRTFGILFTPWGEALIHQRYQEALQRLTNMQHVEKAAIQTNLSCDLKWTAKCDRNKLALWCTYHPGEVDRAKFMTQIRVLLEAGIRLSVGIVGLKENMEEIAVMRAELPQHVYLWINAYKSGRQGEPSFPNYYTDEEVAQLSSIDPLFPMNNAYHDSMGRACRAGDTVISIDGEGTIRRCHFIDTPLGNIYRDDLEAILRPRACSNATCGCYIGYVHMQDLRLYETYGNGVLERIPTAWSSTYPS